MSAPAIGAHLYTRWEQRLNDLMEFVAAYDDLPTRDARLSRERGGTVGAMVAERSLAAWVASQCAAAARSTLPADRESALDARVPGWR